METTAQAKGEFKVDPKRRSFLGALFAVSGAIVSAILAIPLVRFSTFPLRKSEEETEWSDVGPVDEFASLTAPVAKTITVERRDAWRITSTQTAIYVLPSKAGIGQFRILSPICPHLGCSIRWEGGRNEFVCPCHVGSFSAEGERLAGPPPRSMDTLDYKVEGGVLKVRYQYFRQLIPNKEAVA